MKLAEEKPTLCTYVNCMYLIKGQEVALKHCTMNKRSVMYLKIITLTTLTLRRNMSFRKCIFWSVIIVHRIIDVILGVHRTQSHVEHCQYIVGLVCTSPVNTYNRFAVQVVVMCGSLFSATQIRPFITQMRPTPCMNLVPTIPCHDIQHVEQMAATLWDVLHVKYCCFVV